MRFMIVRAVAGALLLFATNAPARPADETQSKDLAAIRAAAQAYLEALNRGDAKALTAAWTADGDYVNELGQRIKAHDLIQQEFPAGAAANTDRPKLTAVETTVRLISPEVAIEDASSAVDVPATGAASMGRFTAVWVKRDGRWLLDAVRESVAAPVTEAPLKQLAWLIGSWTGKAGDLTYSFTASWTENQHFVERKFEVSRDGVVIQHGTQRIGWDASEQVIRSWAFDSQGGHGDGVWGRDGDAWNVETRGVLGDGKQVESSNTYVPGDGSLVWTVKNSTIEGKSVPEFSVKFTRQP